MRENHSLNITMLGKTLLVFAVLISARANTGVDGSYPTDDLKHLALSPPAETNVSLVQFYLWTRENPDVDDFDELFMGDEESISNSHFDPRKKTKILAHGFTSNGMDDFVTYTTEAYLEKGEERIIPSKFIFSHCKFHSRGLQCDFC